MPVEHSPKPSATDKPDGAETAGPRPSNCELCHEPDTSEMVQCDVCDLWHHFACAGVSADIANVSWACGKCQPKEKGKSNNNHCSTTSSVKRR